MVKNIDVHILEAHHRDQDHIRGQGHALARHLDPGRSQRLDHIRTLDPGAIDDIVVRVRVRIRVHPVRIIIRDVATVRIAKRAHIQRAVKMMSSVAHRNRRNVTKKWALADAIAIVINAVKRMQHQSTIIRPLRRISRSHRRMTVPAAVQSNAIFHQATPNARNDQHHQMMQMVQRQRKNPHRQLATVAAAPASGS